MAVLMALPRSPHRLLPAIAAVLFATIVWLTLPSTSKAAGTPHCAATDVAASDAPQATVGRAIRCLVNGQRIAHGLSALRPSRTLRVAAENHGSDMVVHRFFAHVSPFAGAITDRVRRSGYIRPADDYALGEDIAWGEGVLSTPEAIVTAWMNSPPHPAVILDGDFDDVGVGVISGVPMAADQAGSTFVLDVGGK
jgi:uncharacterized protein YkwD